MAYQALYREWRPQTFADVVGQPHIVRTLQNMLQQERVYHAFLFCGPRGTGKTTLAKLLAKALNCQNGPTPDPCLTCPACLGVKAGSYVDVLEIDGASNRGIDEIRDLRERVKYAPAEGRYKVYIIDEVHMLTTEAFNALLKTLEEPPAHVVFVFATTEAQKVPSTIVSRCQRFDFRRISGSVIEQELVRLCCKAGIAAQSSALRLIATAANGGMRDALSMLDQVHSYAGQKQIADSDVQEVVGLVPDVQFGQLLAGLLSGDLAAALQRLDQLIESGKEVAQILDGFVQYARNCLLYLTDLAPETFVPPQTEVSAELLTELLRALLAAEKDIRFVSNSRVPLELALFRVCRDRLHLPSQSPPASDQTETASATVVPEQSPVDLELAQPAVAESEGLPHPIVASDNAAEPEQEPQATPEAFEPADASDEAMLTLRQLRQRWPELVAKVAAEDPSVGAPLAVGQVKQLVQSVLTLQFDKGFSKMVVENNQPLVEEIIAAELQLPLRLNCVLRSESPAQERVEEHVAADEAEKIALSLFEGQEVDSNLMGGPKSNE